MATGGGGGGAAEGQGHGGWEQGHGASPEGQGASPEGHDASPYEQGGARTGGAPARFVDVDSDEDRDVAAPRAQERAVDEGC